MTAQINANPYRVCRACGEWVYGSAGYKLLHVDESTDCLGGKATMSICGTWTRSAGCTCRAGAHSIPALSDAQLLAEIAL